MRDTRARSSTRRDRGRRTLPLAGVPVAIKDNMCLAGTHDDRRFEDPRDFIAPYTATAVQRLLDAGALPIGKTNLDEFAMGSSGENSALGVTRNPYDLDRVPGGSSAGSAASVGGFEATLSLGSDTGGSIREPAAFCNVVGFKPTYGRVSRYGLIAFASSLDQIGPFARTVADAALAYDAIGGHDPLDATSVDRPLEPTADGLRDDLRGVRVGIVKEFALGEPRRRRCRACYEAAYARPRPRSAPNSSTWSCRPRTTAWRPTISSRRPSARRTSRASTACATACASTATRRR